MKLQAPRLLRFAWSMFRPVIALLIFMLMLLISWISNAWDESRKKGGQ